MTQPTSKPFAYVYTGPGGIDPQTPEEAEAGCAAQEAAAHPNFAETETFLLVEAIHLAARAHRGQVDKAGEPYLFHCLRVGMSLLPDVNAALVGILHDVLEDSPDRSEAELSRILGHGRSWAALKLLTRLGWLHYDAYINCIAASPLARKVKIADLRDNLDLRRFTKAIMNGVPVEEMSALRLRYIRALAVLMK
jgi:hypothetical protein